MKINACVILYDETTTLIYFKERKEGKEIEMPQEVGREPEKTQAKEGMRAWEKAWHGKQGAPLLSVREAWGQYKRQEADLLGSMV